MFVIIYFDMHMHFFPNFLAERAISKLASSADYLSPHTNGTRDDTVAKLKSWGCCGGLLLSIATNAHQQKSVNDFAYESQRGCIHCFGSVYPHAEDAIDELHRIKELGLKGIKLHPDYQDFYVDDEKYFPIYEEIDRLGFHVTFHVGIDPLTSDDIHCAPKRLAAVAENFPNLKIIAAHMGGANSTDEALEYLLDKPNVWFDTAYMNQFITPEKFEFMVNAIGEQRIFFATDCPWSDAPSIVEIIEKTTLTKEQKEKIYYKNAFIVLKS